MKSFTLNQKSWHFWLANFGTNRVGYIWGDSDQPERASTDFCSYLRYVLIGGFQFVLAFLFASFLTVAALFMVSTMGLALYYLALSAIAGNFDLIRELSGKMEEMVLGGFLFLGGITVAYAVYLTKTVIASIQDKVGNVSKNLEKADSFSGMTYRKFKDKTCVKLDFN